MAIKGQGAVLSVATAAGSPKVVTGITSTYPPVVSSTAHGFSNGDVVVGADVVGTTEVNNRAFIVSGSATDSFHLKGVDGADYGAYVSGGTFTKQTMTPVSQPTQLQGFDGQAGEIDVTHLQSKAKENTPGLQDWGQATFRVWLVNSDAGQRRIRSLKASQAIAAWSLTLSNGEEAAFTAWVKQFSFDGVQPDGAVGGNVTLRITGDVAWFS